jgi:ABC-2 type transport system permease protein
MFRQGIHNLGGSWFVVLPVWIQALVYANPVSYQLDLLRYIILDFQQLPLVADYSVTIVLPIIGVIAASWSMARMFKNSEGRPMKRRKPATA